MKVTLRRGSSIVGISGTCAPKILRALLSSTSLPASRCGHTPSDRRDGPTIVPYGPALVLASLSAPPVEGWEKLTRAIFGRSGGPLSSGDALSLSLASKWREKTDGLGSILYRLTWKAEHTPQGRSIPRLAASANTTAGNDCTGWPTPQTQDASGGGQAKRAMRTTRHGANLNDFAMLTGWPTPAARDGGRGAGRTQMERSGRSNGEPLTQTVALAGWGTPKVSRGDYQTDRSGAKILNLSGQVKLLNGSHAGTENIGQLSPDFSRWLMGLPDAWGSCAPTVTRSARRKPSPSAKS